MKFFILTQFLLFTSLISWSQPDVRDKKILEDIISYSQENSVHTADVNWEVLKVKLDSIHAAQGLIFAAQYLLKELGDFHGRIWYKMTPYYGLTKHGQRSKMSFDSLTFAQYQYSVAPIYAEKLKRKYGYVRIPGIVSGNDSSKAHEINNLILDLSKRRKPKAWIIDLRLNGGGTMFPMLAGMNSFYTEEPVGSFIDKEANYKENWIIKEGNVYFDSIPITDYGISRFMRNSDVPVVVLTSRMTASSGEVLALSFKNRPNTYFIGEPTAGYTTTVGWNPMGDDFVFQLTQSWYADRLENIYQGTEIYPDLIVETGNNFNELMKDEMILKALEWLTKNK
jgi:carboxyl-terminal processing protease